MGELEKNKGTQFDPNCLIELDQRRKSSIVKRGTGGRLFSKGGLSIIVSSVGSKEGVR